MKEIPLSKGLVAIVDDKDYEDIAKYSWYCDTHGYARRTHHDKKYANGRKTVLMHRVIAGEENGLETDHINGNKLDNRRENLRNVTTSQNQFNSASRGGTSKFKGVHFDKHSQKWISRITKDRILYQLGSYDNERDAAWVYNVWAVSMFGKCARLNVV